MTLGKNKDEEVHAWKKCPVSCWGDDIWSKNFPQKKQTMIGAVLSLFAVDALVAQSASKKASVAVIAPPHIPELATTSHLPPPFLNRHLRGR